MSFFTGKIKIALFLAAMLVSAAAGAFVALKIAFGPDMPAALLQREIREGFSEKISRIRATQGDVLELAVLESTLVFETTDEWRSVPAALGASTSRVSVPAVFRFFVKISEEISVSVEERAGEGALVCTVVAPKLRPVLPVAFDTSRTEWERDVGLLRFNREEMTDSLREKISRRLVISAKNHARSPEVRAAAREAFRRFAEKWLAEIRVLRERPDVKVFVEVLFADEVPPSPEEGENSAVPAESPYVPVSV